MLTSLAARASKCAASCCVGSRDSKGQGPQHCEDGEAARNAEAAVRIGVFKRQGNANVEKCRVRFDAAFWGGSARPGERSRALCQKWVCLPGRRNEVVRTLAGPCALH